MRNLSIKLEHIYVNENRVTYGVRGWTGSPADMGTLLHLSYWLGFISALLLSLPVVM